MRYVNEILGTIIDIFVMIIYFKTWKFSYWGFLGVLSSIMIELVVGSSSCPLYIQISKS